MAKTVNTGIDSGLIKFTFTDPDGEVFAHFRMNPTDIRLQRKCEEAHDRLMKLADHAKETDPGAYEQEVEDCFVLMLGESARETLFGVMSATTILPDGDLFATKVMERIVAAVKPEIQKRANKMRSAVSKHTAKYHK